MAVVVGQGLTFQLIIASLTDKLTGTYHNNIIRKLQTVKNLM